MLKELLQTVKEQNGSLSLKDLSSKMNVPIPLLEQMLISLQRSGKLQEVIFNPTESCSDCKDCPSDNFCELINIYLDKDYKITSN